MSDEYPDVPGAVEAIGKAQEIALDIFGGELPRGVGPQVYKLMDYLGVARGCLFVPGDETGDDS